MDQEILSQLQRQVREISSNSLRRIYSEQFQEWLEISEKETKDFLLELIDERLVTCKFDFECSCGNNCTAYLKKIENKTYQCDNCGKKYTLEDIQCCSTLLYELDKEEVLSYGEEVVDLKRIIKTNRKVVPMSLVKGENKDMEKKKIFIGSSTSVIKKMEDIARIIDDLGGEAMPWNKKGLFVAGQYTFPSLVKIAKKVDGAIFMFNAEDATWYSDRCELKKEVRDNVLLEYGLFAGILGEDKVTFICENSPKIATDLLGITYIKGEQSEYQIKPDIEAWLGQL